MVKNTKGGGGAKKMARKHIGNGGSNRVLREAVDKDEMYAAVSKIYGNGMCEVLCDDGKSRMCIIRNKFRGRGKRDNTVRVGVWVMVGIRSWESCSEKEQKCDLLEVYTESEKNQLSKLSGINLTISDTYADKHRNVGDDLLEFSSTADIEIQEMIDSINDSTDNNLILPDEEVDIDDI